LPGRRRVNGTIQEKGKKRIPRHLRRRGGRLVLFPIGEMKSLRTPGMKREIDPKKRHSIRLTLRKRFPSFKN